MAQEIGLNVDQFQKDYAQCAQTETNAHIQQSKQLLSQSGASGFPTLLIQQQGKWLRVPLQNYLGEPEKWQQFLDSLVAAANWMHAKQQPKAGATHNGGTKRNTLHDFLFASPYQPKKM